MRTVQQPSRRNLNPKREGDLSQATDWVTETRRLQALTPIQADSLSFLHTCHLNKEEQGLHQPKPHLLRSEMRGHTPQNHRLGPFTQVSGKLALPASVSK